MTRAAPQPSPEDGFETLQMVFTSREGLLYHRDQDCWETSTPSTDTAGTVEAVLAVRHGRRPCPHCATSFGRDLQRAIAHVPQVSADPLAIPLYIDSTDDSEDVGVAYGVPGDPDDVRFDVRSPLGWGTASYGINPEEYLGEPTDDDHDWRGGTRYLD